MKLHILLSLAFGTSCFNLSAQDIDQFKWMIGKWQANVDGETRTETWNHLNDHHMNGKSVLTTTNGKVKEQSLFIEALGGDVYLLVGLGEKKTIKMEMSNISAFQVDFRSEATSGLVGVGYKRAGKFLIMKRTYTGEGGERLLELTMSPQ